MSVINLDSFKNMKTVSLDGQEYKLTGINVSDFINGDFMEGLDKKSIPDQTKITLEFIKNHSNIPEEVLLKQPAEVYFAIIAIIQGNDPHIESEKVKKEVESNLEKSSGKK
ncbi:MAG: hypothetical protein GY760_00880 [Deltaproteobacteria bacterium]|nr:hypothetical protein [Deltaproteobacteria bacterium]